MYFPLRKNNSLIPLKRKSPFMRYLFLGYQSCKWSKTFYIGINTSELAKKQTMFQRKMEDFIGK